MGLFDENRIDTMFADELDTLEAELLDFESEIGRHKPDVEEVSDAE